MPNMKVAINEKIINKVYRPYLKDDTRIQIFYGGSSSGKSFFLAQRLVIDMLEGKRNYLVVRKTARSLKKSTFNEVVKALGAFNVAKMFSINASDFVITAPNGYQVLFAGLDDVEKVKSITPVKGVITDVWVEEATECDAEDLKQLRKRLRGKAGVKKRVIMSFNPIYKTHWIYGEYFNGIWGDEQNRYKDDELLIVKTTYKDNEFLEEDDIQELESERDPYWHDVYTLGNWGTLGDTIFTNWRIEDLQMYRWDNCNCGVDFGYARDPAAIVRCYYDRKYGIVYIVDAVYVRRATNDILAAEIKNVCGYEPVFCDEAEPKSIEELRQYGVTAFPAPKGKDSLMHGIQWLQKMQIVIDKRLVEAINEFNVYQWLKDKEGRTIPKPIDRDNHIIDALRYSLVNEMGWVYNARSSGIRMPLAGAM